jgi:hypothetical protein
MPARVSFHTRSCVATGVNLRRSIFNIPPVRISRTPDSPQRVFCVRFHSRDTKSQAMPKHHECHLDDHFDLVITPIDRTENPNAPEGRLADASLVMTTGPFAGMRITGFSVNQNGHRLYVNGPSHWWKSTGAGQTKTHRVDFFVSADLGLRGIPQRVQAVFLDAYEACRAAQGTV